MVRIVNDACVRVTSDIGNEWMDCIFLVDEDDAYDALKVIEEAWEEYWEDDDLQCECFGDVLENKLFEAGISFEAFYSKDTD